MELSATVNDGSFVISRVVPHYISWSKGHKPLGPEKVFRVGGEMRRSG